MDCETTPGVAHMTEAVGPRGPRIYNLFPLLAGPVAEWMKHLPRIQAMDFNWIYVNPFHYPGFSGSIYAVKDYYRLNPLVRGNAYENDETLLASFMDTAAAHGLSVMMDLVINHTSKDALLTQEHPEWFLRDAAGELVSPGVSDPEDPETVTTWGDLAEIDFTPRPDRDVMIAYWQDVVRTYVRLGVRGFRCDAAYKVPAEVWRALMDAAHEVNPDVLFFAETLGCRPDEVEALRPARFDYLFNSSKWWDYQGPWLLEQYEHYRGIAQTVSFPESHDTPRLFQDLRDSGTSSIKAIEAAYRARTLLAATFSGALMIPMGFEYGFQTPLNVVTSRPEDWEKPAFDLTAFITAANAMKADHAVLNHEGPQRRIDSPTGVLGLLRHHDTGPEWVLTVINPPGNGTWHLETDGSDPVATIACSGVEVTPCRDITPDTGSLILTAGDIRVFSGTAPLP